MIFFINTVIFSDCKEISVLQHFEVVLPKCSKYGLLCWEKGFRIRRGSGTL